MRSTARRRALQRYRRAVAEARRDGGDPEEIFGAAEAHDRAEVERSLEGSEALDADRERVFDAMAGGISRRELLKGGALAGAAFVGGAISVGPWSLGDWARGAAAAGAPRIVVVGAGNAGMTAAYRIKKLRGWDAAVYEATDRIGGRCRTITGLAAGQYAEAGGGGISTRDAGITALAKEIGLYPLVDTWKHYPDGGEFYHFNGKRYTWSQVRTQINANDNAAWNAWVEIGRKLPTYRDPPTAARAYDAMSVREFLDEECPNGVDTVGGELMATWFGVDYGGRAEDASALHLIVDQGAIWGGGWDERYAIPGGNEKLAQGLAAFLPSGAVMFGHALVALRRSGDGTYTLTFDNGSLVDVVADRVVLAIPPPVLRTVDLSQAGFNKVKMRSIMGENLGSNAKYNLQFSDVPWGEAGDSGDGTTDLGLGEFWQANFLSPTPATLIGMNNLDYGTAAAHGRAPGAVKDQLLSWVSALWPGASSSFIEGQAYLDNWPNDPWARGSYAYYPPGGFTSFGGIQRKRQGRVHFAGGHTADYIERGFMNGAVNSGERAAREVTSY